MRGYPIVLIGLQGESSFVIGGGAVALRKVQGLLEAGACVNLISPEAVPELETLAEAGSITYHRREYQPGDLAGARLVIAATNDPQINQAVWQEATQLGCLINVIDDPQRCNFIAPAVVRRGDLSLAISTGGASPALAASLRRTLEDQFDESYETLIEVLAELRALIHSRLSEHQLRLRATDGLLNSDLHAVIRRQGRDAGLEYGRRFLEPYWPSKG